MFSDDIRRLKREAQHSIAFLVSIRNDEVLLPLERIEAARILLDMAIRVDHLPVRS